LDIRKLQFLIVDALEDVKAQDIQAFDTTEITSLFDRVVVASGTSNRQTRALAASVRDKVKAAGGYITSVEGEDTGEWVLVDCGDAIVHIMQPVIRQYYRLEELWGGTPVDVKRHFKAFKAEGSPDVAPARKVPKRKAMTKTHTQAEAMRELVSKPEITPVSMAAKKAAGKTVPAKKAPAKKATAAAKKPAVKRLPPARKTAAKVYVGKAAPAKKAATKTVAAKKAPAKKVAAKTTRAPSRSK
jgi:ribosome-associated protein